MNHTSPCVCMHVLSCGDGFISPLNALNQCFFSAPFLFLNKLLAACVNLYLFTIRWCSWHKFCTRELIAKNFMYVRCSFFYPRHVMFSILIPNYLCDVYKSASVQA
jgi:hypothetical protein